MNKLLFISSVLLIAGCTSERSGNDKAPPAAAEHLWTPPAAGTVVAADSMKVSEDALNNTYFSVSLRVREGNEVKRTVSFKYDVHATFGHAVADGKIIMPFGGEHLKPVLRRGEGYSYVVGFVPGSVNGDTAFHEYYRINGYKDFIKIVPLKGYTIDQ